MSNTDKYIPGIMSSIFSFVLSLIFVTFFLLSGLYFGVFNDRIVLSKVNESNYYNKVYQEINDRAESIIMESGLPVSVLDGILTLERVYIGGKYYIEDALQGKEPGINTDRIRQILMENINKYLSDEEITINEELEAGVEEITTKVEQEYKRGIQFQFVSFVGEYKVFFIKILKTAVPILAILAGVLIFFLLKIQKYKHRGIRYISYAMISASSITIITSVCLLLLKVFNRVNQLPDYYNRFLTSYFKWGIQVFLYIGGMGVILSVLLVSLVGYIRNCTIIVGGKIN